MIKIITSNLNVYPWVCKKDIYFRGYFWHYNKLFRGEEAINYIVSQSIGPEEIPREIDGLFTLIIRDRMNTYVINDKMRSFPMFYRTIEKNVLVSDDINKIIMQGDKLDPENIEAFKLNTLWLKKEDTLVKNVFCIPANYFLKIHNETMKCELIEFFSINYDSQSGKKDYRDSFNTVYDLVGKKLVEELNGRTAVIPLSGGYDSRMILDLLKKNNYKQVLCYTYGSKNDLDCRISKTIARDRGYPWYFVEYTAKKQKKFFSTDKYEKYFLFAGNCVSLPHCQDFVAVHELHNNGILPRDSVFVPGHSGDFLAGSHITKLFLKEKMNQEEFTKWFNDKFFFSEFNTDYRSNYGDDIWEIALQLSGGNQDADIDSDILLSLAETVNARERQSKFIINSCRIYEYFGYEWLIPLWDRELIRYWESVPTIERYNRKFYSNMVSQKEFRSTADPTVYSRISAVIRRNKKLSDFFRICKRLTEYYSQPVKLYPVYGFFNNLKVNIKSRGRYSPNTLLCGDYLSLLQKYFKGI